MNGIILAAGRGSRLQKLTKNKPKCLNKVGGHAMLEWQLAALKAGGVEQIYIITGYQAGLLEGFGASTIHNADWESTNMVKSLLCASELFDQPAIVSYSDIIYNSQVVARLCAQQDDAVVVYDVDWLELWSARFTDPLDDAESFKIDSNNQILEIGQKIKHLDDVMGQYTGLMKFSPVAFDWIEGFMSQQDAAHKMDMTTLLNGLIDTGHPVQGMAIQGGWCEIDTSEDLAVGNKLFNEGKLVFTEKA